MYNTSAQNKIFVMQIKIKEKPVGTSSLGTDPLFFKRLRDLAGKWIQVETQYIFKHNLNIAPSQGHHSGMQISDSYIEEVRCDLRPYLNICLWCNTSNAPNKDNCRKCGEKKWLIPII